MRWDERQVALLDAIGIRLWQPAPEGGAPEAGALGEEAVASDREARADAKAEAGADRVASLAAGHPDGDLSPDAVPTRPLAGLDAVALREAAAVCTACPLCEGRTRSVFDRGSGASQADWLVVGEPPVDAEDREGAPSVGKPGMLLDNMLRSVGVARGEPLGLPSSRACVTVPVKCRPPGRRGPTAAEVAACEPYLLRQIELVQPKVILALGSSAALLLRSDEPLGRLRGRIHRYRGLPLVATYAPAYLLRHPPADKARAWDDLCLALEAIAAG